MNDFRFNARTEPRTDRARQLATQAWFTVEPRDAAGTRPALPARTFGEADGPLSHLVTELVGQVDAVDPAQAGHSLRVAALATMLGSSIGMGARELRDLRIAALLHDVGKILVLEGTVAALVVVGTRAVEQGVASVPPKVRF